MSISTLYVYGEKVLNTGEYQDSADLTLEAVYKIGGTDRATTPEAPIDLKENTVLEFVFKDESENATVWLSDADSIREIFPEVEVLKRDGSVRYRLPLVLHADAQERGIVKNLVLKLIKVFTKNIVEQKIPELAKKLETAQLENKEGLFQLNDGFELKQDVIAESEAPCLLFIHGTASSTKGSFGNLDKSEVWRDIRQIYGSRVFAFQHRTLSKSPLENTLELVESLPAKANLHIISHSRGGIVGDILNRFCTKGSDTIGFSDMEINYLNKNKRTKEIRFIEQIQKAIAAKNIAITKFIRVACPASGTTLASSRLDHLFNTIFNLLGLATGQVTNPIYIAFKNLLCAVVESKNNPDVLPGIEAQNPDSPFIEMLNNADPATEITTPLLIIAGNSKPGLRWNGLLVILSKLYYWGANDLIVDTGSMYNGARRAHKKVQYFLDESTETSHFNYFANQSTRVALMLALKYDGSTPIAGFMPGKQFYSKEEIRHAALGLDGGKLIRNQVSGKKPIAVILPGIMGSNLSREEDTFWINYARMLSGGLTRLEHSPENNRNIVASSIVSTSYKELAEHLEKENYDVLTFPFDWRLSLQDSTKALNTTINNLLAHKQPIKLIGHSMGGLLVREFIISYPNTWETLNSTKDFRLLFLGTPLAGSFRIPYMLFGEDDIIRTIAKVDLFNTRRRLLEIFSNFPGILNLLPLSQTPDNDFSDHHLWIKMTEAFGLKDWPIPSKESLADFKTYRQRVTDNLRNTDYKNVVYIAGQAREGRQTIKGYQLNDNGKLVFISTREGDESVTWDSIPTQLTDLKQVYYSDVTHGALACEKKLFKAITDILQQGSTTQLKKTRPAVRDIGKEFFTKPSYNFDFSPQNVENLLLGLSNEEKQQPGSVPIAISLSNGDLKYAAYPVLAGHFINDGLFSAEFIMNKYLDGELGRRSQLGLYPGEIGSSDAFITEDNQLFNGAIITGLGKQGELTAFQLTRTVEQAISKYLSGYNSRVTKPNLAAGEQQAIGISSLVIGCGYGGLSIESSIRAVIQGVQQANNKIRLIYADPVTVNEIEFIELFRDKALSCFHAISQVEQDENRTLNIIWKNKVIRKRLGYKDRLPVDITSDWWTRINVRQLENETDIDEPCKQKGLRFNISTDAAREEERLLLTPRDTILELLEEMSTQNKWNPQLANAIFEMLIPVDFKDQIKRQNNINWILDKDTAAYPWELLQDSTGSALPLSVNAGMIRQLATKDYRLKINPVIESTALIVGDPDLKEAYNQLPGAREEGETVDKILIAQGYTTTPKIFKSAAEILLALFSKSYKIIHLAGHGIFKADVKETSGMVIGPNSYLTTSLINQMSTVPELVFVNCCHLGAMDSKTEALYQNRYKLAASIGTQLIEIGVKAVVVAGWAVDDTAALEFTEKFYEYMFAGYTFGESIKRARKHIYEKHSYRSNTWGAYQCYGDPFYILKAREEKTEKNYSFTLADEVEITLSNMMNELETGDRDSWEIANTIQKISEAVDKAEIRTPRVTELEALLYAGLNLYEKAIDKFKLLLKGERSSFNGLSLEKYCNVRIKYCIQRFRKDHSLASELLIETKDVIDELEFLQRYGTTYERQNLLGSAFKRKAMMSAGEEKVTAYKTAATYYKAAFLNPANINKGYALTNLHCIVNALTLAGMHTWADTPDSIDKAQATTELLKILAKNKERGKNPENDVDFWNLVTDANLLLCLMLENHIEAPYEKALRAYLTAWKHAGHPGNKQTEIEQFEFLEDALAIDGAPYPGNNKVTADDLLLKILDIKRHLETNLK